MCYFLSSTLPLTEKEKPLDIFFFIFPNVTPHNELLNWTSSPAQSIILQYFTH